jgi:hypothetical protein
MGGDKAASIQQMYFQQLRALGQTSYLYETRGQGQGTTAMGVTTASSSSSSSSSSSGPSSSPYAMSPRPPCLTTGYLDGSGSGSGSQSSMMDDDSLSASASACHSTPMTVWDSPSPARSDTSHHSGGGFSTASSPAHQSSWSTASDVGRSHPSPDDDVRVRVRRRTRDREEGAEALCGV